MHPVECCTVLAASLSPSEPCLLQYAAPEERSLDTPGLWAFEKCTGHFWVAFIMSQSPENTNPDTTVVEQEQTNINRINIIIWLKA